MDEELLNYVKPRPVFGFNFSTLMLFRCTKREYADGFHQGKIYFGSPQNWIKIEESGKKGQGDLLEGVFLSTQENDKSDFISKLKTDLSLENFNHNGYTFFRRKAILNLRCLCLYGLHDNSFHKEIGDDGRAHYHSRITKDYFSCFTEFKTREDAGKVEKNEQPVVIIINNPHEFFTRIYSFLLSLDVKREEIIISPVEYLERYTSMLAAVPFPTELLLKDKYYKEQSEVRIIINSSSSKYLEYMRNNNNTIDIGSLRDITEVYEYYYDDLSMERWGSKGLLISLPQPKTMQTRDMSFFELEDLLFNILRGTVKITGISGECKTWNEKLKFIADLFKEKFGVELYVDENKNVSMYNLSQDLLSQSQVRNKQGIKCNQFEKDIEKLINEGKTKDAQDMCRDACQDPMLLGVANYCLGKIYVAEGKDTEAIAAYQISFGSDYKRIESLDGIASIYFRRGEYAKAIELYFDIQDEKGYDKNIWCNIGVCYIHLNQYEKAIGYFDKAIALDANDAYPFYNKGVAYFKARKYDLAKYNMKKAIERNPENDFYRQEYRKAFGVTE